MVTTWRVPSKLQGKEPIQTWYLYQAGSVHPLCDFQMTETDYVFVLAHKDIEFLACSDATKTLRQFDKTFIWSPAHQVLVQIEIIAKHHFSAPGPMFSFRGVFNDQGAVPMPYVYKADSIPYVAKSFKLVKLQPVPEFQSPEEALKWLEEVGEE